MLFLGTWSHESFSTDVWVCEAVLYMKFTGLVTLQNYYQADAYAAGVAARQPHAALLVDARKALLAISEEELAGSMPVTGRARWRPVAFLVPREHEEMFRRLAWTRAQQGLERLVFTSGRAAIEWGQKVATRARVRAALQASQALLDARDRQAFAPSGPAEL